MRRLLPLLFALSAPVVVVAAAGASGSATSLGRIVALSPTRIVIEGSGDLSCRIGPASPPASQAFAIGRHVVISCRNGILTGIRRAAATTPEPSMSSSERAHSSSSGRPSASAVLVGENVPITALTATSITVEAGSVTVICKVAASSPEIVGYRAGDRITRLECRDGLLTRIVR